MKKITLTQVIVVILVIAGLYLLFTNVQHRSIIKDLNTNKTELESKLSKNDSIIKVLNKKLELSNKYYNELLTIKSKTNTIYETKIKEIHDARIISNDSIMEYISSKIHYQY